MKEAVETAGKHLVGGIRFAQPQCKILAGETGCLCILYSTAIPLKYFKHPGAGSCLLVQTSNLLAFLLVGSRLPTCSRIVIPLKTRTGDLSK